MPRSGPGDARLQPRRNRAGVLRQHRPVAARRGQHRARRRTTRSRSRRPTSRPPRSATACRSRPGASSPASAISTRSTPMSGTSSMRRWPTRPCSARSSATTDCSSTGWRRPTSTSSSAPRSDAGAASPAAIERQRRRGLGRSTAAHRRRRRRQPQLARRRRRCCAPRPTSWSWCRTMPPAARSPTPSAARTRVWVADAVWKWAPDGNATRTNFKLQGEYLRSKRDGDAGLRHRRRRQPRRLLAPRSRAGTCRASTSSCRAGASALRTERLDAGTPDYGLNTGLLADGGYQPAQEQR